MDIHDPSMHHILVNVVPARAELLDQLNKLDTEAFNFIVVQLHQMSLEAGGFRNKAGWLKLRHITELHLKTMDDPLAVTAEMKETTVIWGT